MTKPHDTFSLRGVFAGVAFVAWCAATFYPAKPNASSVVMETGAEWTIQNQREYGWPWKCVITRPSMNADRPWDDSLTKHTIREIRGKEMIGNLSVAAGLLIGIIAINSKLNRQPKIAV